ncbi:MAG: carboxypeptidase-like regulatory domain-containing protein, partial [Acidobacteriota bacterium]|nr:carboxypeptidase-like regulatory domain-containing protein [Acidobacteriota bacterium]
TTTDPNLNPSILSRGTGINPNALANTFSAVTFNSSTIADAIAANEYLQFTVSTQSGFRVSLSTLNANFRRSSTGPNTFQYQYSLDGFATAGVNIGSPFMYTGTETNGAAQTPIDLSTIAALQNVASPTTITFRLYAAGATATTGTFSIGRLTGNDLAIGGTVTPLGTTAANATISGRVTTGLRGISKARIMLSGGDLTEPIYARTNGFGYYKFENLTAGETYILEVAAKQYSFANPTLVVNLQDNLSGTDFFGELMQNGAK